MDGTITRKDIIQDDAINWGAEYAKIMDMAIGKNKEFASGILAINDANNLLRASNTQKEYIENQKKVNDEANKTLIVWKEQNQLELALISTKKKNELATESTNRKLTEERLLLAQTNKLIKQETLDRLGLTGAYDKLSRARAEAKVKLRDLIVAEGESSKAVRAATKEFEALDVKVKKADKAVGDFTKNVGNYPTLTGLKNTLKDLVGAFGVATGAAAFAAVLGDAYNTIKKFDQGLADLSAITGATGKDLDFLKNSAIDLGKTVAGGAIAVVEAYKLIASAKPELLSNVKALNQVTEATITLAQAAGMELPAAATALTDAMNQFGAGADQAQIFIDALANGAKYGSAEIPQLTEALLKFGAVSRTSNIDIKESTALVELLAENGLKGAEAGTALRNVLLKLSAPDALPKKAQEAISALGISFKDLSDTSKPIQERLEILKPLLKDNAGMVKVFGVENVVAATNILGHTERLKELTKQMNDVGTAEEQAAIRMDTVTGKTEQLKSTYDSLVLSIGQGSGAISEFFKFWIDGAKGALESLIYLNQTQSELNKSFFSDNEKRGQKSLQALYDSTKSGRSEADNLEFLAIKSKSATDEIKKLSKELRDAELIKEKLFRREKVSGEDAKKITQLDSLKARIGFLSGQNTAAKDAYSQLKSPKKTVLNKEENNATGPTEKEIKDALARAKKLNDSKYELAKQTLEREIKINEEIAKDEEQNDSVRIAALEVSNKKQIALTDLTKKHSLDYDKFVLEADKLNANQKTFIANEAANKIVDINKKTAEDIGKIREFDDAKYQKSLEDKMSKLNVSMNTELQAENERFKSLGDLEAMTQADKEKAVQDHEQKIYDIKKAFAIKTLKLQIVNLESELAASDLLPANEQLSADKRQKIAETLSKVKLELSEVEVSSNKKNSETTVMTERKKTEKILEMSSELTSALTGLGDAVFERKIQNIEDEITKNNEYYDRQIELAGNDERQKDLLTKEREKKNEELEKKKRKEQHKQAVFNKASAVAQAGISAALAVLAALSTQPFLPMGPAMAILAGVLGAIQIGAILATPIPKYKTGRKGGPAETAWVGDGFVHEVITGADGSNPRLTPNTPTLTNLGKDDIVHKSVADYNKYIRASILNGFGNENKRINEFQSNQYNDRYGKETLDELRRNTQAIKAQKFPSNNNSRPFDINHLLWKMGNTKWN